MMKFYWLIDGHYRTLEVYCKCTIKVFWLWFLMGHIGPVPSEGLLALVWVWVGKSYFCEGFVVKYDWCCEPFYQWDAQLYT